MATRRRPDEKSQRRKEMRQKFRSLIRSVMFNRIWLAEAEEQKMSLNVKKNIAMLVRTHEKIGTLTIAEKAIIRSVHWCRSVEDRKKLVTLIAGLTCFQTLPPKVRARLVPYVKFMLVTSGRTIIREGDEPHMTFFILSGEVEVTKKVYDHVTKTYIDQLQLITGPGDYIGDIEFLENTLRTRSYISRADTEMLVLYDEADFDRLLRPVMAKEWEDKKKAIKSLDYFNFFTEEQLIICCKLAFLKQFDSLETIYHEDKGALTYVHFIISGECMILQCLKMRMRIKKKKRKSFELVEITKDDVDELFKEKTKQELLEMMLKETRSEALLPDKSRTTSEHSHSHHKSHVNKSMEAEAEHILKSIEIKCGFKKKSHPRKGAVAGTDQLSDIIEEEEEEEVEEEGAFEEEGEEEEIVEEEAEEYEYEYGEEFSVNSKRKKSKSKKNRKEKIKYRTSTGEEEEEGLEGNEEEEIVSSISLTSSSKNSTSESSILATEFKPTTEEGEVRVENRFIDVGSLTFGGVFGLGEKLEHRVIMARTTVQCLMIPRFWLFEKEQNPGNIWQRRRFYLDCTIPSRQSLFKDFITTRKWQAFKTKFIQSNLQHIVGNPTKTQDVPIICRIVEASDD